MAAALHIYTHLDINSKLLSLPLMRCLMLADTWALLKLNPPTPTYSNTITTAAGASAREGSWRIYEATVSGPLWPSSFRPSFTTTHPTAPPTDRQLFTRAPSNDTTRRRSFSVLWVPEETHFLMCVYCRVAFQ